MLRQTRPAIVGVLIFIVFTGLLFPFVVTAVAQAVFHDQANGSLLIQNGKVVGSQLIGQNFSDPKYFHPRPSAAGNGYDPMASGGTNLSPSSAKLIKGIHQKTADGKDDPGNFDGIADLAKAYRAENHLAESTVLPSDAVTRSGSGLDPHISPMNAELQAARVAEARKLSVEKIKELIANHTEGRQLAIEGEARINVLNINLALDELAGKGIR